MFSMLRCGWFRVRVPRMATMAQQQQRNMTTGTSVGAPLRKKVTSVDLIKMKQRGKPITMCTAYTYPSAMHVDAADIDVLLVGDSLAMVELGHDTTLPVTVDQMLYHCKSVARGADRSLLVADLPFGSYESSSSDAYATAIRFLKEAGMDAVKLEGGRSYAATVRKLVDGGVATMGHIGLTPQRISVLGGFRAQGKTAAAAQHLLDDALALQDAGCFALVIECVPASVAALISERLAIPTIGIGAGAATDGQVLVYHDLLGMLQHAHHARVSPSFCKQYAEVGKVIQEALNAYKLDVEQRAFPAGKYSPYKFVDQHEEQLWQQFVESLPPVTRHDHAATNTAKHNNNTKHAGNTNTTTTTQQQQGSTFVNTDENIKVY